MLCPKCGAIVDEKDNFCEDCGASLKKAQSINSIPKSDITAVDSCLALACNIGRKHPDNEDAGTVLRCPDGSAAIIVADGVSSALNAVSASSVAVSKLREVLGGGHIDIELIKKAINEANEMILALPYETREDGIYGPETTIIVAAVSGDNAEIAWVGDSRAYVIDRGSQKLLTTDDSWVELVVSSGEMTREEAMRDRLAHCVTQVLGMHDQDMDIHILDIKLKKDEMLLLCTDGLWNYFQDDNDLSNAIVNFGYERDAVEICDYLVGLANNWGGRDNITAALLRYN